MLISHPGHSDQSSHNRLLPFSVWVLTSRGKAIGLCFNRRSHILSQPIGQKTTAPRLSEIQVSVSVAADTSESVLHHPAYAKVCCKCLLAGLEPLLSGWDKRSTSKAFLLSLRWIEIRWATKLNVPAQPNTVQRHKKLRQQHNNNLQWSKKLNGIRSCSSIW